MWGYTLPLPPFFSYLMLAETNNGSGLNSSLQGSQNICFIFDFLFKVAKGLSAYMQVYFDICVGGTNVRDGISAIRRGVHFVVDTPGRINDLINRNVLETGLLKLFALDEADEMFSRGFKDQVSLFFFFRLQKDFFFIYNVRESVEETPCMMIFFLLDSLGHHF